jgi:antitoxin component of MazEF toxin-antitoxin module
MKLKTDENGNVVVQDGQPVYIHPDGKEAPFDAAAAVSKISALNREAQTHREAKETAEAKAKAFEGIEDAEAAIKALETVKNLKDGDLVTAGKVEEIKAAAKRAAEEQVAAAARASAEREKQLNGDLEKLQGQLHNELIGGNFGRSKLISDKFAIPADLVQARFGQAFKVEEGKVVAYDQAGNKIFSRSRAGEVADFDEALETLVDQYPYKDQILKGTGASGSGAGPSGTPGGGAKKGNFGGSKDDRLAAITSKFPELAQP